jgi:hypothetical protein
VSRLFPEDLACLVCANSRWDSTAPLMDSSAVDCLFLHLDAAKRIMQHLEEEWCAEHVLMTLIFLVQLVLVM